MTDRNVQYPYRFHVRPVPGTDDICEIIPAPGTVYEDGTFWNKQNVLKDATAALYGKGPAAVPDEIFAAIRPLILEAKNTVLTGSYNGTGTETQFINLGFAPSAVVVYSQNGDTKGSQTNGSHSYIHYYSGMCEKNIPMIGDYTGQNIFYIQGNGFYVLNKDIIKEPYKYNHDVPQMNLSSKKYFYLAFR